MFSNAKNIIDQGLGKSPFFAHTFRSKKVAFSHWNKNYRWISLLLIVGFLLSACTGASERSDFLAPVTGDEEITGRLIIYSGRSEPLIQPVLAEFNMKYPEVEILLRSGRNSELANALIEEQNNPQADVFVSTELFTIQALNNAGIFQSYHPQAANELPTEAIGPDNNWVGLTRRARVIMYNTELVSPEDVPQSIFDLTDPRWRGQIAAAGSTNGSMQAQIAAMRQLLGEENTEEWLRGLQANDTVFFGSHTDVRTAVGLGEFQLGLVNHYYYHLQLEEGSPVGIVYPDQGEDQIGLLTNLTAVGIVSGAPNPQAAQAFVDYLLSSEGQQLFSELNYEYPLVEGVPLQSQVETLEQFRLADINVAEAARDLDQTFALFEKLGIP